MSLLYNDKLESLMKKQSEMSEEENEHFLNELRKSELLVPLQIELESLDLENMNLNGLNEINKEVKFHLKSFTGPEGKRTVPIFTDEENGDRNIYLFTDTNELEKAGYQIKSIAVNVMELSIILAQFDIDFNYIVINPYSVDSYKIDFNEFLENNNF